MSLHHLLRDLQKHTSGERAKKSMRFFHERYMAKNDRFVGVTMPELRKIARKHDELSFKEIKKLLISDIHEYRMIGGILLVNRFKNNESAREDIFNFYLENIGAFNNWDLVDVTCHHIIGAFARVRKKKRRLLYELSRSKNLWEKRISIVATYELIKHGEFEDTLKIAKKHLSDKHDLMHKAVGWMLREVGKRDEEVLLNFLKENYENLPRTTLRYAIERFSEEKRKEMLHGKFE